MDRRRDAACGCTFSAFAEPFGVGHPHTPPLPGREWPVGFGLDVLEQRRRPRTERAIREAFLPADGRMTVRVRSEARTAPVALLDCCCDRVIAHAGMDADRQTTRV